jgi:hypothetical protein
MDKVKTNGKEFKAFYNDASIWSDGITHDDESIVINGEKFGADNSTFVYKEFDIEKINDTDEIILEDGCVINEDGDEINSFAGYFKKWKKKQSTTSILIEVPISELKEVIISLKKLGIKVIK